MGLMDFLHFYTSKLGFRRFFQGSLSQGHWVVSLVLLELASIYSDRASWIFERKDYFEIPWASLRVTVETSFMERSLIHHQDYLAKGRLIISAVINITKVLIADGYTYGYLVVATIHYDPLPVIRADRLEEYHTGNEKIKAADSILIVGGGPTGVELAAEIAVDFAQKKVTLVHDGSRLLEFIGPKVSDKTLEWLRNKNVEVALMQSVDISNNTNNSDGNRTYFTSSGETIRADCHFLYAGKPPGSEWLRETYLKDRIDNLGRLKVDENLRVKGHRNIFVVGDKLILRISRAL